MSNISYKPQAQRAAALAHARKELATIAPRKASPVSEYVAARQSFRFVAGVALFAAALAALLVVAF